MQLPTIFRRTTPVALFTAALFFASCAHKEMFQNSSVVPGAQGSVTFGHDGNKNATLDVKVSHLANPEKLTPPRKVYVLWETTDAGGARNIGRIEVSSFKGRLKTVTTDKAKRIFITAEDDANVAMPSGAPVLTTGDF